MNQLLQLLHTELQQLHYGSEPHQLYDPIRYMMDLGGKRLRPLLTLVGADLFGADPKLALKPALGVEVFHNFTLMHDDIMDQAPLRRGQETVHQKWNSTIAILSGDVMLVKAFDLMMQVEDKHLRKVLELFSKCATEVCEGQQYDMNFETSDKVSIDEYITMIRLKTAVLVGFALQLGAVIGGANDEQADLLREFATDIGIAFQLKDDMLDVYADKEKFGKQVGGDILANKKTFLLLTALEKANPEQREQLQHWLQTQPQNPNEKVQAVTAIYDAIGVEKISRAKMDEYFTRALEALEAVDASTTKKAQLRSFAEDLMSREV
ncbi:MAG: polyprenyl synthetase family protein [Sphingobacteriales bacterium]|nr:MAG: polyprenyl synthetase family protein [Sphingobacteriales bacterium]